MATEKLKVEKKPFSHYFCAFVYRSRDALLFDNRRDFTQMEQTDLKPLILSMLLLIINCFNHLLNTSFRLHNALFKIFISHNLTKQTSKKLCSNYKS